MVRSVPVLLVLLSVFFENTGFMKAGPRQNEFEPTEGKIVKFSDVHEVDEAKEVCYIILRLHSRQLHCIRI